MLFRRLLVLLPGLLVLLASVVSAQNKSIIPPIKFEEYRLSNGLRVILHVDKSSPVVAVNVWYHVGSKNETFGKTGFAHLFEHLMFMGSKNYNANFHKPLEEAGTSSMNGITTSDTTNYFEVLPSNYLELALYLEADRMGNLLDALTQEKLDNAREVVKNELRQAFENLPYGTWRHRAYAELYPKDHPYRWHPSGSIEDLSKATLEDAKAFFSHYYVPNNAILSVAGNFDVRQAKVWIQKYFGPIEKGENITRPNPPHPKLNGEIRRTVEDSVSQPRLFLIWHGVRKYAADEAALEILVGILSRGRSSRFADLFKKTVVQNLSTFHEEKELGGLFIVQATPASGKTVDDVEKEISLIIDRIKKAPPSDKEISRIVNQIEYQKLSELQTPLIKGDLLGDFALFLNKPDYFRANVERYRRVTAADIKRVANVYLGTNRLVLTYVPRTTETSAAVTPASSPKPSTQKDGKKEPSHVHVSNLPKPGPNPKVSLPSVEKQKLTNGLEIWLVRHGNLPIVTLSMVLRAGVAAEPEGKYGIHALTSSLLRSGTKTRSAVDISDQLQLMGAITTGWIHWDYELHRLQT
jgi:zinc protease